MTTIHPTAIVEPGAQLGTDVVIGPYCIVGAEVSLADRVRLMSHVVIAGRTHIGAGTEVYPFAALGLPPQDLKYRGEPSSLKIGENCMIREHVTMHPGTAGGIMETVIGNNSVFLAAAHVAHDCRVGDRVILSNNAMIAGHCTVEDHVILGGGVGVHQFCRIGAYAFLGGLAALDTDVIPFGMALGNRAQLAGLNVIGLRRAGFTREDIQALRRAYGMVFGPVGTLKERIAQVDEQFPNDLNVQRLLNFVRAQADRALCLPRAGEVQLAETD